MRRGIYFLFLLAALLLATPQTGKKFYLKNSLVKNSTLVPEDGRFISSDKFRPENWYPCKIPSTVLNCLVKNNIYPDPYTGLNNLKIPDASESYNIWYDLSKFSYLPNKTNPWKDPYWFRTEFELERINPENIIWLVFEGINYRADVWLNGRNIADSREMAGMFREFRFNITKAAKNGKNYLAIKIYPLDFPGLPSPPYRRNLNGGETGDIGKNVTMQCSAGWDWIPPVRDRNMGIWQDVYIEETGPVIIRWPVVVSDLPLPGTSPARLTISTELKNLSEKTITGDLKIFIGKTKLKKRIILKAGEQRRVKFSPDKYRGLVIHHPRLWWPAGYGKPELYSLLLEFEYRGNISDIKRINFGIRKISTKVTYVNGWARRDFFINGKRIFIRGGAWVPDMMLRRSTERIYDELRLIKEANLNLVRIWGGGITPPEEFFDACDRLGLLVWHDFWTTGDCQGTWGKGSKDWPVEPELFLKNAEDVVLRLRNHPSILLWTAGNEGYPGKNIYVPLRNRIISELDGTRPFLPSSGFSTPPGDWGLSLPDNGPPGVYSGGPYSWVEPETYYRRVREGKDWLFKDEVGTPSMISLNSAAKFIKDFTPDPTYTIPFFNKQWRYHFALYELKGIKRYGFPQTLQDLVMRAQLMGINSYRAIFEAANTRPGDISGIMLWKLNPAWPEVRWQIYDYFLKPIPAYYYIKRAASQLHIQLDPVNYIAGAVNHLPENKKRMRARIKVYTEDMREVINKEIELDLKPMEYKPIMDLKNAIKKGFYLVKLELLNADGNCESENFYWISRDRDYSPLENLERAELKVLPEIKSEGKESSLKIKIYNISNSPAFFIHLSVLKDHMGEEVLPSFWSDNYFSLLPGEEKIIRVKFKPEQLENATPYLLIEGWNLYPQEINLKTGKILNLKPEISRIEIPAKIEGDKKLNLCFTVKNPGPPGPWITTFPVWIEQDGKITIIHTGLRGQEKRKICVILNHKKH